jgi:antagonist of KipI
MGLEVLRAGLQSTVQDQGRFGYAHLGVSASGAADNFSLTIGNILVGNPKHYAGIEMTIIGDKYHFKSDAFVALTGSEFEAELDNKSIPFWKRLPIKKGQILDIRSTKNGARCYLCVAGGINIEDVMGAKTTHLTSGIGGLHGRILKNLDELEFGPLDDLIKPIKKVNDSITTDTKIIKVTKGAQWPWFDKNQKNKLFQHQYQVTKLSNRMGLRLIGNAIKTKKGNEITTAGISLGSIQIPGDGQPIISFVEHQTTGGYPIIANVVSADIRKVGQLKAGDCFQFELISFSSAEKLKVDQEKFIHNLNHD